MKQDFTWVGKELKKFREQAGITQKQVSDALNLTSPQYVSNWERGLCMPSDEVLISISEMYGTDKKELIETMVSHYRNHFTVLMESAL